jgi:hypothetical protein
MRSLKYAILLVPLFVPMGVAAQTSLLAPKGAKATVTVEYAYAAAGMKKDKYDPREWKVNRSATLTAQFVADKPQPMAQLRAPEAAQMADLKDKQATARSAAKKMTPMMGDMMKIVEKCGDNEACIEKEVEAYGKSMELTPELKSAGDDIDKLGKTDGPRYQMWKAVSQKGTYTVDEFYKGQSADPLCMEKPGQRCHREETRKGSGDLGSPPGKKDASGAMFEVDAQKKDIVLMLPGPMMPMAYNREIKSDFPSESEEFAGKSQGMVGLSPPKPLTVTIPGDLKKLAGTEQIKLDGAEGEGGTLTVRWTLSVL